MSGFKLTTVLRAIGIVTLAGALFACANRAGADTVSYHRQIWPILQAKCQACHQPASAGGSLVVTSYAALLKGSEHGVVLQAGKPEGSVLLDYLTGKKTLMPKGGPPLSNSEIALFRAWIADGARDDTPLLKDPIDSAHPPVYTQPPVITALAYSPDGKTLAVSGYREVLLQHADGSGLIARLVGRSQKILSISYSADGHLLAAAGGTPALFGEVQFWDTSTNKETESVNETFDTLFGGSISPDGKKFGFGGTDNSVRVVSVPDGKEIMRLDNHSDWVLATTFSMDSQNILSASRDQAIKLTQVNGGSFIDDINTHFSAMRCLVRNPKADQVLCGGDDGIPRLYKIFRTEARTMNQEDHNLLRAYERQPGVISSLAFSADGAMIAVGTESGVVNIYASADGKPVATIRGNGGVVFAVAFAPDSKQLATGGFDGTVRLFSLPSGTPVKSFVPVPIATSRHSASTVSSGASAPAAILRPAVVSQRK